MIKAQSQQGFVLLVVLVALLFISMMTALLLNQAASDTQASGVAFYDQQLSAQADTLLTPLWQASDDGWLHTWAAQIIAQPDVIHVTRRCTPIGTPSYGQSTGVQDMIAAPTCRASRDLSPSVRELYAYARPIAAPHYAIANESSVPDEAVEPAETTRYFLITAFAVAHRADVAARTCHTASMHQQQAMRCYQQAGILVRAAAAEWLMTIKELNYPASDLNHQNAAPNNQADDNVPTVTIKKLRFYQVNLPRE